VVHVTHPTTNTARIEDDRARQRVQVTDAKCVVDAASGVRIVVRYHLPYILTDNIPLDRPLRSKHTKAVRVRPTQHEAHSQADLHLHVPAAPATCDAAGDWVSSRQDTNTGRGGLALPANSTEGLLPVHTRRRVPMRPTGPTRVRVTLTVASEAWTVIGGAAPGRGAFTPHAARAEPPTGGRSARQVRRSGYESARTRSPPRRRAAIAVALVLGVVDVASRRRPFVCRRHFLISVASMDVDWPRRRLVHRPRLLLCAGSVNVYWLRRPLVRSHRVLLFVGVGYIDWGHPALVRRQHVLLFLEAVNVDWRRHLFVRRHRVLLVRGAFAVA